MTSHSLVRLGSTVAVLTVSGRISPAQISDSNGGDPPRIAGVALGDSARSVSRALGAPERRQESLGLRFWDFPQLGFSLTLDKADDRVHVIIISQSRAGAVAGVRVGDSVTTLRRHWGSPARLREHGRFLDFIHRGWTCTAELRRGHVAEITLTLIARAP